MAPGPSSARTYYERTYYERTYYGLTYYEIAYFVTFLIENPLNTVHRYDGFSRIAPQACQARFFATFWPHSGFLLTCDNICS